MVFTVTSDSWLSVCLFTEAFSLSFALSLWSRTIKSNQRQWNDALDVLVGVCCMVGIHLTSDLKKLHIFSLFIWSPLRAKTRYHKTSQEYNLIWFSQKGSINWLQPLDRQFMFCSFHSYYFTALSHALLRVHLYLLEGLFPLLKPQSPSSGSSISLWGCEEPWECSVTDQCQFRTERDRLWKDRALISIMFP